MHRLDVLKTAYMTNKRALAWSRLKFILKNNNCAAYFIMFLWYLARFI